MRKKIYLLFLLLVLPPNMVVAADICGEAPNPQFRTENNESIKGDLQSKANFLSSFVGKAELGGKVEQTKREIFAQYPDADKARTSAYLIYLFCQIIFDPKNTQTTEEKLKALEAIRNPQKSGQNQSAYRLGKAVAWRSFFETEYEERDKDNVPDDIQQRVTNNRTEIQSYLKDLGINVDIAGQDFRSTVLKDYQESSAARFYKDAIGSKHGDLTSDLYYLGLQIGGTFWMAQKKRFGDDVSAPMTLSGLNAEAKTFGARGISVNSLNSTNILDLNKDTQHLILTLDGNIQDALKKGIVARIDLEDDFSDLGWFSETLK